MPNLAWSFSPDLGHQGVLVPEDEVKIPIGTHALHYGSSVIEGIRRYGSVIFRLFDHIARLRTSARMYGMTIAPFTVHELMEACLQVAMSNPEDTYIRPIVYRGSGLGVNPLNSPVCIAVISRAWGKYLIDGLYNGGADVKIGTWLRCSPDQMPVAAKGTANYVPGQLSKISAAAAGVSEEILLAPNGVYLSEASGMNLFILTEADELATPDAESSCLLGLTRDTVLRLAREGFQREVSVAARPVTASELMEAREAFFTGTATEITPITRVNGREIGSGKTGEFTQAMSDLYQAVVRGHTVIEPSWVSIVPQLPPAPSPPPVPTD